MKIKRTVLVLMAAAVLVQTPLTVMAHGHHGHGHGGGYYRTPAYAQCNVEGCSLTGIHEHDGAYYCGHYIGDGHTYHGMCTVEGCTEITEHIHDDRVCMPYCTVEGCGAGYYCGAHCYY